MLCHFVAAFWPKLLVLNYGNLQLFTTDPSTLEKILGSPLTTLVFNGHFAVLVFFVLSGYVLASPALENDTARIRARFWGRYARLNVPVAAACILSWLVLSVGLNYAQEASVVTNSSWLASQYKESVSVAYLIQLVLIGGLLGDGILMLPLWTLRVEFIGSMALLGLLALSPKNRQVHCLAIAGAGVVLANPSGVVFILCFIAGALCNWIKVGRNAARILFFAGLIFGSYQPFGVDYFLPNWGDDPKSFYNAVGGVCLTLSLCRGGILSHFLKHDYVQYLGRISYSMYLLHFVTLCSISSSIVVAFDGSAIGLMLAFVVYIGVTIIFSHVFTIFVDDAAVRYSRKFSKWVEGNSGSVDGNVTTKSIAEIS